MKKAETKYTPLENLALQNSNDCDGREIKRINIGIRRYWEILNGGNCRRKIAAYQRIFAQIGKLSNVSAFQIYDFVFFLSIFTFKYEIFKRGYNKMDNRNCFEDLRFSDCKVARNITFYTPLFKNLYIFKSGVELFFNSLTFCQYFINVKLR